MKNFSIILFLSILINPSHAVIKNGFKESPSPEVVIKVSEDDIKIIREASEILKGEAFWNRKDDRVCPNSAKKFSLYCALYKASVQVTGDFDHRLGALEEVRRTVEEYSQGKNDEHRLMGFNNDSATNFKDIKNVLLVTESRLTKKFNHQKK